MNNAWKNNTEACPLPVSWILRDVFRLAQLQKGDCKLILDRKAGVPARSCAGHVEGGRNRDCVQCAMFLAGMRMIAPLPCHWD